MITRNELSKAIKRIDNEFALFVILILVTLGFFVSLFLVPIKLDRGLFKHPIKPNVWVYDNKEYTLTPVTDRAPNNDRREK